MQRAIWIFAIIAAAGLSMGAGAFMALQLAVRQNPGQAFTREGIMRILTTETEVYYADGKTLLGTFFEGQHRDYVPYDSIPTMLVDALVAAEDEDYFTHGGVDYGAILAAMVQNIKAGRIKRGGSTLSQQAAKNLFNRRGRSIRGKVHELVNALRLERNFTKKEILEFYLNQFYVSGNGHGVGIAARYFFDKPLADLTLGECAFIAGSVKGPNQYNPFIQKSPEKKAEALERGRRRVAYVLGRMLQTGKITPEPYKRAMEQGVRFKRGAFRFSLSTNMVKVQRYLETPRVQELLGEYGVEEFMSAGLRIYTTLDHGIQRAAEYAIYSNLSRLQLILGGYRPPEDTSMDIVSRFEPGAFYTGRVCSLSVSRGAPLAVQVRFGAAEAWVDSADLEDFFRNWNRHEKGSAALPPARSRMAFVEKHLSRGSPVFCSVPLGPPDSAPREGNPRQAPPRLRLEVHPVLQGGAQVLREGRVLANVGGFQNTGYDRVNQARRQFGSAFKPIVYAAALELGWKPFDPLPNTRQLFRLGKTFYFPKPDHTPEDTVSIAWAGRRSENIASVYLLFHLFDKTDFARFWEIGREAGYAPENFHMDREFMLYVRDTLGLVFNEERRRELEYQKIVADVAYDLIFSGKVAEAQFLKDLPYGLGFADEQRQYSGKGDAESKVRHQILDINYLNYVRKVRKWRERDEHGGGMHIARHARTGEVGLFESMPPPSWLPTALPEFWIDDDSLLVEGMASIAALERVSAALEAAPEGSGDPYSKENLYASQDFRALAGLQYIVHFSRKLGITSPLEPVISFPLGVNVISLGEAVGAYETLKDGFAYGTEGGERRLFVERITLRDGTEIFRDEVEREKALRESSRAGLETILGLVVSGGTGRAIHREVRLAGEGIEFAVPCYGKTGTTNDYRNGAFLGWVASPRENGGGFDSRTGYALGVYIGFDDNAVMSHRGFRGTGSSVAVPAWIDIANAVVGQKGFADAVDFLDLEIQASGQAPVAESHRYEKLVVSKRTGLPVDPHRAAGIRAMGETYREDISHEMEPSEAAADPSALTTIFIRQE